MLELPGPIFRQIVAHCIDGLPDEACGLLAGRESATGTTTVTRCYPTANAARSAKLYEVDSRDLLTADRDAEQSGLVLVGVFHSHTHTAAYPSPTDVAQAPDPAWHYVLVSLRDAEAVLRSYRIVEGNISEEPVVVPAG